MFGRAFSRPIQKLETDPSIAIVPCEALSKRAPQSGEKSLTQLVGGNAELVGENAIAFSCSEGRNFHLAADHKLRTRPRGAVWLQVRVLPDPPTKSVCYEVLFRRAGSRNRTRYVRVSFTNRIAPGDLLDSIRQIVGMVVAVGVQQNLQ